jgi:hypothetical protein
MRQVCTRERLAELDQHGFLNQIDGSQMRADQFEIISAQRRQKSIG